MTGPAVKRFSLVAGAVAEPFEPGAGNVPAGAHVQSADYDALLAQRDGLNAALCKARDALADLNQRENDDGALLDEIDAALAKANP